MVNKSARLIEGPVQKTLIKLTLPMVLGTLGMVIFNLSDTFFVGQLGTNQLAALTFTFDYSNRLWSVWNFSYGNIHIECFKKTNTCSSLNNYSNIFIIRSHGIYWLILFWIVGSFCGSTNFIFNCRYYFKFCSKSNCYFKGKITYNKIAEIILLFHLKILIPAKQATDCRTRGTVQWS